MYIVNLLKMLAAFIEKVAGLEDKRLAVQFDKNGEKRENEYKLEDSRKKSALKAYDHAKAKATEDRKKNVTKLNEKQSTVMSAREELSKFTSK